MLFFGIKNFWFKTIVFSLFAVWTATCVFLIYRNYFYADPFNPALTGTKRYGHNSEGDFNRYLLFSLIEFLILMAILLPYSFSRFYFVRPFILQSLFFGWMLLMAVVGMHAGSVHALHTVYLLGVNALICILLIAAIIAEIINRRKKSDGTRTA